MKTILHADFYYSTKVPNSKVLVILCFSYSVQLYLNKAIDSSNKNLKTNWEIDENLHSKIKCLGLKIFLYEGNP